MASRVVLKNILSTVNKQTIIAAFQALNLGLVKPEDINIVRKGQINRVPECTVFITLESDLDVAAAVQCLQNRVLPGLSNRAVVAELATPRMSTLKHRQNSQALALEDYSQLVKDNLPVAENKKSEGQYVLEHWQKVKHEPADDHAYAPVVDLTRKVRKLPKPRTSHHERLEPQEETPWGRRQRLRREF